MPRHPDENLPRKANDDYQTPFPFARQIVEYLEWVDIGIAADPCAGAGNLLKAISDRSPCTTLWGNDAYQSPSHSAASQSRQTSHDILDLPELWGNRSVDRIITNLPYSMMEPAFRVCLSLVRIDAIFLMPVGWLYTQKRYKSLHSVHLPADEWRLPARPSFAKGGNDFTDYVWLRYLPTASLFPTRVHYLPPISRKDYT